jgi:hypothetical protein
LARAQPRLRGWEGSRGNIQIGEIREVWRQKVIQQRGSAAAGIDDTGVFTNAGCVN